MRIIVSDVILLLFLFSLTSRTVEYLPRNKQELTACILTNNCQSSKNNIRTHMYVMPEWYYNSPEKIKAIRCFITDFQEPYVMLRYSPETPLFDERFVNYGYNKVQLIEHLRAMGYQFYILNNDFAVDLPHPDSKFRKSYLSGIHTEKSDMREVYSTFQRELNEKYKHIPSFKICKEIQDQYYSSI